MRGEVIIHQVGKALGEQTSNGEGNPLGNQRGSASDHITPIDDDGNDGGIGGRAPNAALFERFHQAGFGVSSRRLRHVGFSSHLDDSGPLPNLERRQDGVFLTRRLVLESLVIFAFLVSLEETFLAQHCA